MKIGNKVWQAQRAATASARARLLDMLSQPVRVRPSADDLGTPIWYEVRCGGFRLSGGGESWTEVHERTSWRHVERNVMLALTMIECLHGPMTSTKLFQATLAALPAEHKWELGGHSELWNTYHRLMGAGLLKFVPSAGGGLGGRVEVIP